VGGGVFGADLEFSPTRQRGVTGRLGGVRMGSWDVDGDSKI